MHHCVNIGDGCSSNKVVVTGTHVSDGGDLVGWATGDVSSGKVNKV